MKIREKRAKEILGDIIDEALSYLYAHDIIQALRKMKTWQEVLEESGESEFIGQLLRDRRITEEEFQELSLPHIGKHIARDIGAKEVIIKW